MSPTLAPIVERVAAIFQSEEEAARKTYSKAVAGQNVAAPELAAAMKLLRKSVVELTNEQAAFAQRKAWAEETSAIPALEAKQHALGKTMRQALEDHQASAAQFQVELGKMRTEWNLLEAELQTKLAARAKLAAGRPEFVPRLTELHEGLHRDRNRMSDVRAAIATAERGLAVCRQFLKHPAKVLDVDSVRAANEVFGVGLLPGVSVTIAAERVQQTFDNLTISLSQNKGELSRLEASVKEAEKEIAKLEKQQLEP